MSFRIARDDEDDDDIAVVVTGTVVIGAADIDWVKLFMPFLNAVVVAVIVVVDVGPLAVVLILHSTKDILRAICVTPVKILLPLL